MDRREGGSEGTKVGLRGPHAWPRRPPLYAINAGLRQNAWTVGGALVRVAAACDSMLDGSAPLTRKMTSISTEVGGVYVRMSTGTGTVRMMVARPGRGATPVAGPGLDSASEQLRFGKRL